MNKEEKEAIEKLKNREGFRIDYKCKKCGSGAVTIIPQEVLYGKEIDIVLNYINKLQKENETLQENNISYQEELARVWKENEELKDIVKVIRTYEVEFTNDRLMMLVDKTIAKNYDVKFISKDKIRDKLNHAKEVLENLDNERDIEVQQIVINYLMELLGE